MVGSCGTATLVSALVLEVPSELENWRATAVGWEPSSEGTAIASSSTEVKMAWCGIATPTSVLQPSELDSWSTATTCWLPGSEGSTAVRLAIP